MSCNLCTNPALCNPVCRAFEFAPAAVRAQLREDCAVTPRLALGPVIGSSGSDWIAVGGFRFDEHAGWQQVAAEYATNPDVTTLYRKRCASADQVAAHVEAGEMKEHCPSCGGSGDVHDLTGEWRGRCTCSAGVPVGINGLTEAETSATASVFGLGEAGEMEAAKGDRK